MLLRASLAAVCGIVWLASGDALAAPKPFRGFRALVVEPENFWGWDTAVLCALQGVGFDVTYGDIPDDPQELGGYALVALTIKRSLSDGEQVLLRHYVEQGGALYGSWGGPMAAPAFLRDVCGVGATRSVRVGEFDLLETPLTEGIGARHVVLAEHVGHMRMPDEGREIVSVEPTGEGIPVARDADGRALGVLNRHGAGRTAVLGFGPEQDKYYTDPDLAPALLHNLLSWLVAGRPADTWSGRIEIALPARALVTGVSVDGRPVAGPSVKRVGSLRVCELDFGHVAPAEEATVTVTYEPLTTARNVEVFNHLPWNVLVPAAESPAELAEHLASLHTTTVQPLLRGSFGQAWYKGMPEDKPAAELVADYEGDFLADLIAECRKRDISVVAGIYFDNATPLRQHPEAARISRDGEPVKNRWGAGEVCFNRPEGRAHNLATIEHLLSGYDFTGIILDDTFEMDARECFCDYCKADFRAYCERNALTYADPAAGGATTAGHWRDHRREATNELAQQIRDVAHEHGVAAGGWVTASMGATHLGTVFDFLGGMVYTEPPRAIRGPLSVLGECDFVCLLWAPNSEPARMEREVQEAVHSGAAAVGFWIRGEDGGYRMDDARVAAMRRALGHVEQEWEEFYRQNVVAGDARFAIMDGEIGTARLELRLRNTGEPVESRFGGPLPDSFTP